VRSFRAFALLLVLTVLASAPVLSAQSFAKDEQAIRAVMAKQIVDWNNGDLDSFAKSYKNAPDILFVNAKIYRGYAAMLDRYKTSYPTREKMGITSYSQLEVQPLGGNFATVTGHFHLERTAAGGGNADGYFMVVFEKTPEGWKIVRDDTTALPKAGAK
jgi:ketosteroid isomerase-like protein